MFLLLSTKRLHVLKIEKIVRRAGNLSRPGHVLKQASSATRKILGHDLFRREGEPTLKNIAE